MKNEIITNVNKVINNMQTQITNEQNIDIRIFQMQDKIIEKIERTIIERESDLFEKLEKKSKEDLEKFTKNLLNS